MSAFKNHTILYWIYQTIVLPTFLYGSLVCGTSMKNKAIQHKAYSLQRSSCLCITGALRTTPTAALEVILNTGFEN